MSLTAQLREIMTKFAHRHGCESTSTLAIRAENCWSISVSCDLPQFGSIRLRNLQPGDVRSMADFGTRLGPEAKEMFCPYPWKEPEALPKAFQAAIEQSVNRVDASYLIEDGEGGTIGHFFLWKAGGNPHSQAFGLELPELGVAVADAWQGKGLGSLSVRILQAVARDLQADAVELTTAMDNGAGWNTYLRCGFEYTGIIRNPLDVDVTAAINGDVQATRFRDERQMVEVINDVKRECVLDYLATKRQ